MISKVKFEVLSGLHCNFLNCLIDSEYYVSSVQATDFGFIAVCFAKDYKKIAKLARKFQCRTKILKRKGLWFKIRKILVRKGLFAGAAAVALCIWFFTNLIWRIDIISPDKNITQDIYSLLYRNDVYAGAFFSQEKNQNIIQQISKNVDNVGYVTLNFYKGILTCKVDPTINKMPYLENRTTGNITASMDGVIEELEIYNGFSDIKIGQSVSKGDILVSATFIDRNSNIQQVMPRAYIKAYCQKQYSAYVPYNKKVHVRTGEYSKKVTLKFMNKELIMQKANIEEYLLYESKKTVEHITVLGFRLPLTKETVFYYKKEEINVHKDEKTAKIAAKIIVDTVVESDVSLVEPEETEYTYIPDDKGMMVYCNIKGHFDITK